MRLLTSLLALLVFLLAITAGHAGEDGLAGNWKITFLDGPDLLTFWLLKLDAKDGKLTGSVDSAPKIPPTALQNTVIKGSTLAFTLELGGQPLHFVLEVPKGQSKRLLGTITVDGFACPVQLLATKDATAKGFEPETTVKVPEGGFKELKAEVAKRTDDLGMFALAHALISVAVDDKVPPADLKAGLAPVLQAARNYGDWHRGLLLQSARQLASRDAYAALAEEFAQEALQEFGTRAAASMQLRCLDVLALSLFKQNKKNDLANVRARIGDLEPAGHEENEKSGLGFAPDKFGGRKGQRVVLVELFTGAHCPPCVAADLAFEGLAKTYATSEVVLLQHHLHVPAPDPLTTPDTEARAAYYSDKAVTPTIIFNGKPAAVDGGYRPHAAARYKEYRGLIEPLLAGETNIALSIDAKRAGDRIDITATAAGYKPADKLKLRLALVEPWVRYPGNNGLSYHAHVVRALPGGPDGFALTKDSAKETAKVDLAQVRQKASKSLDEFEFLDGQRPFSYRNLRVVAFIQDDETKEVLHAVEVPVRQ